MQKSDVQKQHLFWILKVRIKTKDYEIELNNVKTDLITNINKTFGHEN